jgi:hypothetical protein
MAAYKYGRGITWVELSFALLVIVLFSVALASALSRAQQAAERSVFDWTARNLRIGLQLKVAHLMTVSQQEEMQALIGSNPALLLDERPLSRYAGEKSSIAADIKDGIWYFDISRRELVYRFHRRSPWLVEQANPSEGRLSIQARNRFGEKPGNGVPIEGIELVVQIRN